MRKTKIVCTIGPVSESLEMFKKLINGGMNVCRLNFSHGDFEEHGNRIKNVRQAAEELNKTVAILLDTKGPEIRTGKLKDDQKVELVQDQFITLTTEEIIGDANRVHITYADLPRDVRVGATILIDDGLIGLEVVDKTFTEIKCRIVNGGLLGGKKGVNVPGVKINLPGITEKTLTISSLVSSRVSILSLLHSYVRLATLSKFVKFWSVTTLLISKSFPKSKTRRVSITWMKFWRFPMA